MSNRIVDLGNLEELEMKIKEYAEIVWSGEVPEEFHKGFEEQSTTRRAAFYAYVSLLLELLRTKRELFSAEQARIKEAEVARSSTITAYATIAISFLALVSLITSIFVFIKKP